MHVLETGTSGAPAVVFLHGLITCGWTWQQQAHLLNQYHCLIPDPPSHGHSQHLLWVSIEDTAQQVAHSFRRGSYIVRLI